MGNACSCESAAYDSEPVFSLLAQLELQLFYDKITSGLGVRTVKDLAVLDDEDLQGIGMKKVQRAHLQNAVTQILSEQSMFPTTLTERAIPALNTAAVSSAIAEDYTHPLLQELEQHHLGAYYSGLRELGVNKVTHLSKVTKEDLIELGMKRFDLETFAEAYLVRDDSQLRPHFGVGAADESNETRSQKNVSEESTSNSRLSTSDAVRPHYGSPKARSANIQLQQGGLQLPPGRHVMLSYQWDSQKTVLSVRDALASRQVPTWMDVDGGMQSDVYDSMAEGVQNAAGVVAFMTQRYQDSNNCKLEAKFACEQQVQIIPVMMQADWRASGWLGILTAGALWVPLHDEAVFEQGVDALFGQISKLAPAAAAQLVSPDATSLAELRTELDKLRSDLRRGHQKDEDSDTEGSRVLASLPAEVPVLPSTFRATAEMQSLKALLLGEPGSDMSQTMTVTSQPKSTGRVGTNHPSNLGLSIIWLRPL
jgi:hypothetical protein